MSKFKNGDRVRITKSDQSGWVGLTAVVINSDSLSGAIVLPDTERPDGYGKREFYWDDRRMELVLPVAKPGEVNALIAKYATDLRKNIDNGTMVAPYSEIGIFASFLLDYNNLETE